MRLTSHHCCLVLQIFLDNSWEPMGSRWVTLASFGSETFSEQPQAQHWCLISICINSLNIIHPMLVIPETPSTHLPYYPYYLRIFKRLDLMDHYQVEAGFGVPWAFC